MRAATGTVIGNLTGNGLHYPSSVAFDGQRILATNRFGPSVSLWQASDLSPLGSFSTGNNTLPAYVCSDGISFWIALDTATGGKVARF